MARVVEPLLTQPTKSIEEHEALFKQTIASILTEKAIIAAATAEKNEIETLLIDEFFGRKAKGSITIKAAGHEVKVEFNSGVKSDLKALADALPKNTFDLVFPPKREFSASAHNALVKDLEAAALTNPKKQEELNTYLEAYKAHVTFTPNKPSVKID